MKDLPKGKKMTSKKAPASVKRGLAEARKIVKNAPDIIAARSKNIQLRNEMIHARMAEDLRSKAVLKQAEVMRLGYKDGLVRDNEKFKKGVRDMMAQSLGELRGGQLAIERGMNFHL